MDRQASAHKRRLEEEEADTVREDYVKKMRDNYPLIIRTLMHDLIVSIDKDGVFVFLNDAAVEFFSNYLALPLSVYHRYLELNMPISTIQRWPVVTLVVPAHNEEKVIERCLDAILEIDYPKKRLS